MSDNNNKYYHPEIQEGFYDGRAVSWSSNFTKNDKPQVNVKVKLRDIEKELFYNGSLVGNAIEFTCNALKLFGFKGKTANDLNNEKALNPTLIVAILVKHKMNTYTGKMETTLGVFPKSDKKPLDKEEQDELERLDLRAYMDDAYVSKPQETSNKLATQQKQSNAFTADDIPF